MRVKVVKYGKGYVISVGIDPEDYDLPTKIFYNNKVVDPIVYSVTGTELKNASNRIYVTEKELPKMLADVKNFYTEYAKYNNIQVNLRIMEGDTTKMIGGTIEENEKIINETTSPIRKITIRERVQELLGKTIPPTPIADTQHNKPNKHPERMHTPTPVTDTQREKTNEKVVIKIKIDSKIHIPEV